MSSQQKQNLFTATGVSAASTTSASYNLPGRSRKLLAILTTANINAATTVTVTIVHSPDKINWFTYMSFTAVVGTAGVSMASPSSYDPPVFPYVAAQIALSGTTKLSDVTVDLWFQNYSN